MSREAVSRPWRVYQTGGEVKGGRGGCCSRKKCGNAESKDGQASKVQVRGKEKCEWWTEPDWNPNGNKEENLPHPQRQGEDLVKCGRSRKWTSGSESMIQRRMARREKEGIALRGVA